eukprot:scaffold85068_cov39-Phaeocystis_antarctica.AAC.2
MPLLSLLPNASPNPSTTPLPGGEGRDASRRGTVQPQLVQTSQPVPHRCRSGRREATDDEDWNEGGGTAHGAPSPPPPPP